ncbi:nose resistant to fluoxetine protein 6-like isoform X2 [Phymastichus coffea]|uniref:nose resistant to fluoxetine protein 6-like isoform X2 n=1 Tax=Phymastichus coffea TaxID=108790 RepID=UPI00273CB24A|nr:nose resistant to fluoxetine protein 6-like isoform X2 [Phymastichus coffea]
MCASSLSLSEKLPGLSSPVRGSPDGRTVSDASGRYSSQYHFGNGFWLGSSALCREVNATAKASNDTSPFLVQFYVTRMFLMLPTDIESTTRQVFIGLCLPISCEHASVKSMLRASAERVERQGEATHRAGQGPKIHIVQVRKVPSTDYSPWNDPKFYALACASALTLLLMICATIYEYRTGQFASKGCSLSVQQEAESLSASNNNDRPAEYADKNLEEQRGTGPRDHNDKELIERMEKGGKAPKDDLPIERDRGLLVSCLLAFSPMANGGKIVSVEPATKTSLTCLHGLRVLSLGWVVMVHTYLQVFSIAENKILRTVTERNFMFQTISNATFSVDTFFFISGLLVTILFYRSMSSGGTSTDKTSFFRASTSKFLIMIFYRFVRLTPSYLFVLGLNLIAMKYAMSVTVFSPQIIDHHTCEQFWWRNALYVNSLYPRTEMCMLWSWYMANDMQFYVLGISLLLLSVRYFRAVAALIVLLMVSSWFTTFSIAYGNDYVARIQEPFALFDELYDKPWLRAGPYFIGTMTGYLLFKTNCSIKIPLLLRVAGWIGSSLTMCSLVYGLYPENLSVTTSSLYASLGHTAWAVAVSFIVVQCCTGAAPLIDRLLSLRLIYPLSRLTYCAYLVHPMIMMFTSTQMDGPLHLHNGLVMIVYFGNFCTSYLMAFCISLSFEAPIVNLLKLALSPKKRRTR